MQRVELIGGRNKTEAVDALNLNEVDPTDLIVDPEEIKGIIRRAVTILWKNEAFTYDELAAHISKNYGVLPRSIEERDAFFDETLMSIWHREKELSRVALTTHPTRLRFLYQDTGEYLHGIIVPYQASKATERAIVEVEPAVDLDTCDVVDNIIELSGRQPVFTRLDIARFVFNRLIEIRVYDSILEVKKITHEILKYSPATEPSLVDEVINMMTDGGYITIRNTGKKKYPRLSIVMDQDTKRDVIDDMAEGKFEEGIEYIFGERSAPLENAKVQV